MADTQDDDELIIVETDELPEQGDAQRKDDAADDDGDHQSDEDDEGGDDDRLHDEDDDGEDDGSPNRKKRLKRRQVQKEAKERTLQELRLLRQQNEEMARRLAAVEGTTLSHTTAQLDQRISDAQRELQEAEMIIARAVEAGNGEDVAVAMRIRDAAKAREADLLGAKEQVETARNRPPAPDTRVTEFAGQWMAANPWYDPKGTNEDSAITNAIDARLVAEGYNPATVEYWEELTSRVAARINPPEARRGREAAADDEGERKPRRKAPPIGGGREHAPASTRREVYVTPERKQAMMDAGVWDDPVARNRMLKAYQAYDREQQR